MRCPGGMSRELPEPRKQHHGCDLCVWHALQWPGEFITFLRENFVEEDLCTLVSGTQLPELQLDYGWQTCSWMEHDFCQ